jgi:tRNA-2-methylthio-N6-dimethylallyladenosine synthase
VPKLVSHLHLPVQHGSDRILMAMKRGYTVLEYKSVIRKLRAIRPDMSLSTDFIVGFPGETEDDFDKMMKLVDESFDTSFSFIYSPRPARRPPTCTTTRRARSSSPPATSAGDHRENVARISQSMVGTVERISSKARRARIRTNCRAAPRTTAWSTSRRRSHRTRA